MNLFPAVVVSGPDGSGKSTLIDEIIRQLDRDAIPWRRVYVRPKRLDRCVRPRRSREAHPVDPHHSAQLSPVMACAKAVWMALDAGTLCFDRRWARRIGGLILIERGIEDAFIDPTRYGLNRAPAWFLRRIVQLFSVGDRVVLCVCPPSVAFGRKGETGVLAMEEQYRKWQTIGRIRPFRGKLLEVDTERPVDSAIIHTLVMRADDGRE